MVQPCSAANAASTSQSFLMPEAEQDVHAVSAYAGLPRGTNGIITASTRRKTNGKGSHNLRTVKIEKHIMIAELILDGLYTHNNFKHCMNPIHAKRIARALSNIRSARDLFRHDTGTRQWTLTTRSKRFNRHGLWHMYCLPEWRCDCNGKKKPHTVEQGRPQGSLRKVQSMQSCKEKPLPHRTIRMRSG